MNNTEWCFEYLESGVGFGSAGVGAIGSERVASTPNGDAVGSPEFKDW